MLWILMRGLWLASLGLLIVLVPFVSWADDSELDRRMMNILKGGSDPSIEDDDVFDDDEDGDDPFADMSLDDLMSIEVTAVSGSQQSVAASPAAIFVITREDIRRSGFRNFFDVLRLVPGLSVSQVSPRNYTISIRWFDFQAPSRLLIVVDGRPIEFAGSAGINPSEVFIPVEEIESVEVVRGPGAALWGSSALNGMIMVTTRNSSNTLGTRVTAGFGSFEQAYGSYRNGMRLGDSTTFRYGLGFENRNNFEIEELGIWGPSFIKGANLHDDSKTLNGDFRLDHSIDAVTNLRVTGSVTDLRDSMPFVDANDGSLIRSTRKSLDSSLVMRLEGFGETTGDSWHIQVSGAHTYNRRLETIFFGTIPYENKRQTFDFEARRFFQYAANHQLGVGVYYRYERRDGEFFFAFDPSAVPFPPYTRAVTHNQDLASTFVQHSSNFFDDRLQVILGSKFEHDFDGNGNFQHAARMSWKTGEQSLVWSSVSQGKERDNPELIITDYRNEMTAEAGFRTQVTETLVFDLSFASKKTTASVGGELVRNYFYATEAAIQWQVTEPLRLKGGGSWLKRDGNRNQADTEFPTHQFQLRAEYDVSENFDFNAGFYYVDNVVFQELGSRQRLDVGAEWRPAPGWRFSAWGQNLLDEATAEFSEFWFSYPAGGVPRGVYFQAECEF